MIYSVLWIIFVFHSALINLINHLLIFWNACRNNFNVLKRLMKLLIIVQKHISYRKFFLSLFFELKEKTLILVFNLTENDNCEKKFKLYCANKYIAHYQWFKRYCWSELISFHQKVVSAFSCYDQTFLDQRILYLLTKFYSVKKILKFNRRTFTLCTARLFFLLIKLSIIQTNSTKYYFAKMFIESTMIFSSSIFSWLKAI